MSKLILEEMEMPEKLDVDDFNKRKAAYESKRITEEEIIPEQIPEDEALMTVNSMIRNLIQSKWQAIDLLNSNIAAMQQYDRPDVSGVLQAMIADNYIHIGQLEKLLQIGDSGASQIDAGKEDIEDDLVPADHLEDEVVEVEPVEEEPEEVVELPEDDVPADLVDEIDFKKKEEEE